VETNSLVKQFASFKKSIEEKNKKFEQALERLQAVVEIQNLMSRHEYLIYARLNEQIPNEIYAKKALGVKVEMHWGIYEGIEGLQKLYAFFKTFQGVQDPVGYLCMHALTTPIIEVAGDEKTAKGLWITTGRVLGHKEGNLQSLSPWNKNAVDFIKEDGQWKVWHRRVYKIIIHQESLDPEIFSKSKPMQVSKEFKPDRPSTYNSSYNPNSFTKNVPAPPESYETWDDSMACVSEPTQNKQ
jgi:hypothetical protein